MSLGVHSSYLRPVNIKQNRIKFKSDMVNSQTSRAGYYSLDSVNFSGGSRKILGPILKSVKKAGESCLNKITSFSEKAIDNCSHPVVSKYCGIQKDPLFYAAKEILKPVIHKTRAHLGQEVGKIKIKDIFENKEIEATIKSSLFHELKPSEKEIYRVFVNDSAIGIIELKKCRAMYGMHNWRDYIDSPDKNKFMTECYAVSWMKSSKNMRYSGVGRALHELAVQRSLEEGLGGRVILETKIQTNSPGFHWTSGYRPQDENHKEIEEFLKSRINQRKSDDELPKTSLSFSVLMYLPEKAIEKYRQKLQKNPVLYD